MSAILGAGLAFGLTGCQPKSERLVYDNYARIRLNVATQAEVSAALGEPDHVLGDQWVYDRPDRHLTVMVDFAKNKRVSRKQWVDGTADVWEDTDNEDGDARSQP